MTADDVITDFELEVSETIADGLKLKWLRRAILDYSRYRPRHASGTINVVADTTDYAAPTGAKRIKSLWDETDGQESAVKVPFDTFESGGLKIRLTGCLPTAGTTLTAYFTGDHTLPDDANDDLTVAEDDSSYLVDFMRIRYMGWKAQEEGKSGSWKMGDRAEDNSKAATSMRDEAKALKDELHAQLQEPCAIYGDGHPAEAPGRREQLDGTLRSQGPYGWVSPGLRRRVP